MWITSLAGYIIESLGSLPETCDLDARFMATIESARRPKTPQLAMESASTCVSLCNFLQVRSIRTISIAVTGNSVWSLWDAEVTLLRRLSDVHWGSKGQIWVTWLVMIPNQSLELSTSFGRSDPIFASSHFQSKALKTQEICEEDITSPVFSWSFGLIIAFYHLSFFGWWFQMFWFCGFFLSFKWCGEDNPNFVWRIPTSPIGKLGVVGPRR